MIIPASHPAVYVVIAEAEYYDGTGTRICKLGATPDLVIGWYVPEDGGDVIPITTSFGLPTTPGLEGMVYQYGSTPEAAVALALKESADAAG